MVQNERERVLPVLDQGGPVFSPNDLPETVGLYALWPADSTTLTDLSLEDVEGEAPLVARPLYVGKAEREPLRGRVSDQHFASGDTGHSTLRRSLAALLDLEAIARHTTIVRPTRKQLLKMTSSFDLTPADDERLSRWMSRNLVIRVAPSAYEPLKDLERAVAAVLRPPLDQEPSPMWGPNPWRPLVAAARERVRSRLRCELGLE